MLLYQKLVLMHVTKIVRLDCSAVFENFRYNLQKTCTERSCILFGANFRYKFLGRVTPL